MLLKFIICFDRNKNFSDSGLTNFGKSLENLPALNSISLNFYGSLKKLISHCS